MNYRLVKLKSFSGSKATVYSVILQAHEATQTTLYDRFIIENKAAFPTEVKSIAQKLITIGHKTGANENFFKDWEGKPGDGVCALYDDPDKSLRLYCIKFGRTVLVVGGGGHKPPGMRALQEDEKLTDENELMRQVSKDLAQRIRDKEITWSDDELELLGDFNFYTHE